jgi:hypothetical protein
MPSIRHHAMNSAAGLALSISALGAAPGLVPAAHANQVLTYHNNNTRHGLYVIPSLTLTAAGTMAPDTAFHATISGQVYAQPLYWAPKGAATAELIVATENNIVYALNATTGAVIWQQQLPAPVTSGFSCGNINPSGITGTPVIDPSTGTLYLNSETTVSGSPQDEVYALSLSTGAVVSGWPINVQTALKNVGVTFNTAQQGSRSALLFLKGNVYVSYGGRSGDCTPYHGTIVQIDASTKALAGNWETRADGGGIWSQGGVSTDGTYIYATTGNTIGATTYGDGETIARLVPGLSHTTDTADFFAPANWQTLDNEDADLGGTEALAVNVATGSGTYKPKLIALGKDGNAYMVNRANLGGIGGPASIANVSGASIITGPAVYNTSTATMLAFTSFNGQKCSGENIQMLDLQSVGANPITVKWCASLSGGGSPIITTTDGSSNPVVWVLGAGGDNKLHAFNAMTGASIYNSTASLSGLHNFQTLIAANNKLYVAADNTVYAFTFTP